MWIHIPSNEKAWRCWRQGKSVCVNKGNLRGRTRADIKQEVTTSKGKSQGTYDWENAQSSTSNPRFWQDTIQHERSPDVAETFSNNVTSAVS